MATYPTLSRDPIPSSYKETKAYDPSIRSQFEDGKILSRARFTANKKRWDLVYTYLTTADKVLLDDFQDTVMVGADTFTWTNPDQNDNTSYTVRLEKPIEFKLHSGSTLEYQAMVSLIED